MAVWSGVVRKAFFASQSSLYVCFVRLAGVPYCNRQLRPNSFRRIFSAGGVRTGDSPMSLVADTAQTLRHGQLLLCRPLKLPMKRSFLRETILPLVRGKMVASV